MSPPIMKPVEPFTQPPVLSDEPATASVAAQSSSTKPQGDGNQFEGGRFTPTALANTIRRMSKTFEESDIHPGFMAATGSIVSSAVNPPTRQSSTTGSSEVPLSRLPSFNQTTSNDWGSGVRRMSSAVASPSLSTPQALPDVAEHPAMPTEPFHLIEPVRQQSSHSQNGTIPNDEQGDGDASKAMINRSETAAFENGYHFPPSYTAWESTKHFSIVLWKYFLTPVGFLVVIYGLNVIAWGGMLFLLLCNAAPAMCHPTCNDIESPRRKWMEIDSQIINALFCITGFGLAPWRTRDLWYLMQFRVSNKYSALQRLAGIYSSWFRLLGSKDLPVDIGPENLAEWPSDVDYASIPIPPSSISRAPLTAVRAEASKPWKMDTLVWMNFMNTIFQILLASFMWSMNRYQRPSWVTGLLVSLGIISSIIGGLVIFFEGKRVKNIEGVLLTDRDVEKLKHDKELGISHYNNLNDKKPKLSHPKKNKSGV